MNFRHRTRNKQALEIAHLSELRNSYIAIANMKLIWIILFVIFQLSGGTIITTLFQWCTYVSGWTGNGQSCNEGEVRLQLRMQSTSFSQSQGTVLICINEVWGTICSNGWDSRDAAVVCRQLGFPSLGNNTSAYTLKQASWNSSNYIQFHAC